MPKSISDALFSKVRQSVLGVLFCKPGTSLHLREIARLTGMSAPGVRQELESLTAAGVLKDERRGNQRLFVANADCPLFPELCGIVRKTFGIADRIRAALDEIEGIEVALIFGSVARGEENSDSDVDVLVIGGCSYSEVVNSLHLVNREIRREISPKLYSAEEFAGKVAERNSFVRSVLDGQKIYLKGELDPKNSPKEMVA